MTGRIRTYRGKPKTCEATTGFDEKRHMLLRCKEPATLLFLSDAVTHGPAPVWVALCEKCFLSMRCEGDVTP